ncbi:hypothetical protein ENSA5_24740 [Enhygromyxa salina]|uniref:Uncharacterized protein n=2 Tax=Enhygromyxa salina TaxID=215803 RepID=A0A2S9YAU5_9BACT|nr:hypothetical protein ENSA5_24740 [Enhygromyxa salina]
MLALAMSAPGCTGLTPQLHPTDIEALEQLEDREERDQAYIDNAIVRKEDARGVRYTKGSQLGARPRNWQSLDLILRSDRNSAAALPEKKIRAARVLTGFLLASSVVLLGGIASSAREGLDLEKPTGTSAALLGGGLGMLAFGIASGVVWGQARAGYEGAVDIYNDSLALRLGISDANGEYRPPSGVLVDEEGFIILDQKELAVPQLRPQPPPPVQPEPAPIEPMPLAPDAEPEAGPEPVEPETAPEISPSGPVTGSLVGPARGRGVHSPT